MPFARPLALLCLTLLFAAPARAVDVSNFCSGSANPCEFNGQPLNVTSDTTLDFGNRTLIIGRGRRIDLQGGVRLSISAGSVIMRNGSRIGNGVTPTGASVSITADNDILMETGGAESRSRIEVAGSQSGGSIQFTAGGNVVVDGELRADGTTADASAGIIDIDAGGGVTLAGVVNLTAGLAGSGGELVVGASGPIIVNGTVDASGGFDGGTLDFSSNASLSTSAVLDIRGTAAGSLGGNLIVNVVGSVTLGGKVFAQGVGSLAEGGGSGGDIDVNAGASITINDVIDLSGGGPEGFGGLASFVADVDIIQKRQLFALGAGTGGIGGDVSYSAGRILSLEATNDVGGSGGGGDFAGSARDEVQAKAEINVNGDGVDGSAGAISLDGLATGVAQVSGDVVVSGTLLARGPGVSPGGGGSIVVQGCNVTVLQPGAINSFGDRSNNLVQASGLMTIAGSLNALPAGTNVLQFRDVDKQPVLTGTINPAATPTRVATLPSCLPPVPPLCGNGEPEAIEGCDDGNLTSCDGCSGGANGMTCHAAGCCQVEGCGNGMQECTEVCDDGNVVDGDGCDSNCTATGCGNGRVTGTEECDDDNTVSGDGCSATCIIEPPPGCGNGMVTAGEDCDDGNTTSCDGCSKLCRSETCGNGVRECAESCDDGGILACDGTCAADCTRSVEVCGDSITECSEECDAGAANGTPGSACSGFCVTCTIGSGADCPCGTDFDCHPAGRCAGLACTSGSCSSVEQRVCNDNNACNGVETCASGECVTGAPPSCVDDDPCTEDACTPAGGCPHARKTGFPGIDCRLDSIEQRATDAAVADLPSKLRAKILKLVGAARTRIATAERETKVKRQRKLLKVAESKVSKLLKVINKGLTKQQITEALGTRLREEADGARGAARALRAGLAG